jgi:hypothetical protein
MSRCRPCRPTILARRRRRRASPLAVCRRLLYVYGRSFAMKVNHVPITFREQNDAEGLIVICPVGKTDRG